MTATVDPSMRFILPQEAPLLANLAALWAVDASLAEELETVEPYSVEPGTSGDKTLSLETPGGKIYLHSRHNPRDEARRLIDSSPVDGNVIFAVHGFALGYHVEELIGRAGDEATFIFFEPDPRLLRTAFELSDFSDLIRSGRALFFTRPDHPRLLLRLTSQQAMITTGLGIVSHQPSLQLHPEFHRQTRAWMDQFVSFSRTNINTLVINGRRTCENIAKNLGWYAATPGINRLKMRHQGQPAIIVSAGPSLRKNIHLLRQAKENAILIAVQTTLQPMLDMGIEPDYVTSLDYHDICTRFFEKLPPTLSTELVAEAKATSAIFSLFPGPLSIVGNDFADRLLGDLKLNKNRLRAGATVAHLAFYLAEYLGCDPIIFIGQDLGFSDALAYSPGTSYEDVWRPELGRFCTVEMKQWEHIARERPILRKIPDQHGRPMYTEERLFSYLQQFERDFSVSPAKIIDATEGGALKRGAEITPLAEALKTHCTRPIARKTSDHPGFDGSLIPKCRLSLSRRIDEARQVEQVGQETLPLLREVKENLRDQPKVNQLIARIDALRARMTLLNNCYEIVTQLTQQTELHRFQSDRRLAASKASGVDRQRRQLERDIRNVEGIIAAAGQFQSLIEQILPNLEDQRWSA